MFFFLLGALVGFLLTKFWRSLTIAFVNHSKKIEETLEKK